MESAGTHFTNAEISEQLRFNVLPAIRFVTDLAEDKETSRRLGRLERAIEEFIAALEDPA